MWEEHTIVWQKIAGGRLIKAKILDTTAGTHYIFGSDKFLAVRETNDSDAVQILSLRPVKYEKLLDPSRYKHVWVRHLGFA